MQSKIKTRVREETQREIKHSFEAILSAVFFVVGIIFAAIVATGFGFDIKIFKQIAFYLSTAISFGLMMYAFALGKRIIFDSKKRDKDSDYFINKGRNDRVLKYVHDGHHNDVVEAAVDEENELRRKAAAQKLLNDVTYGLDIELIENLEDPDNLAINEDKFNEFAIKRGIKSRTKIKWFRLISKFLERRRIKQLRKVLNKVLNGKYKYEHLTAHDLLVDTTLDPRNAKQMKVDTRKLDRKENRKKAITFLISTAITNALAWNGLSWAFVTSLLTQATLIFTSLISAFFVITTRINTLTLIYANRNEFLYNALKEELKNKPLGPEA